MRFNGIQATIRLDDGSQFEILGVFWQAMRQQADPSALRGIGHSWDRDAQTFDYLIGLPDAHAWDVGSITRSAGLHAAHPDVIDLPDQGWLTYRCAPKDIAPTYAEIWRKGDLRYEIEYFDKDGTFVTDVLYRTRLG